MMSLGLAPVREGNKQHVSPSEIGGGTPQALLTLEKCQEIGVHLVCAGRTHSMRGPGVYLQRRVLDDLGCEPT